MSDDSIFMLPSMDHYSGWRSHADYFSFELISSFLPIPRTDHGSKLLMSHTLSPPSPRVGMGGGIEDLNPSQHTQPHAHDGRVHQVASSLSGDQAVVIPTKLCPSSGAFFWKRIFLPFSNHALHFTWSA